MQQVTCIQTFLLTDYAIIAQNKQGTRKTEERLYLDLDMVESLPFMQMKCYATVLPNVPIEITTLSPLDAG